ncbi:MAG TPA: hypothetical protein VGL06_21760, partial [Pseudonocardiaceae bacterium]
MGSQRSAAARDAELRRAREYEARARAGGDLPTRTFDRYATQAPTTRYPARPLQQPPRQPPPRRPPQPPPRRFPGSDEPTVEMAALTDLVNRPTDFDPDYDSSDYDDRHDYDDRRTGRGRRQHHRLARPVRRAFLLALALCLVIAGISVVGYLTAPGTDTTAARVAEWARDHGMGDLVTFLEQQQYQQNQPKVGGAPAGGIPVAGGAVSGGGKAKGGLPAPAALPPLAG